MEQQEERRLFTYEERKATLQRTYGICACCGKKLTTKTMTMEHIIPLSRGGKNEPENLIALCYDCNQLKGNMLYLPSGFYSALINKPLLFKLDEYVANWFRTIKDEFDLTTYPLIAPRYNVFYSPVHDRRRFVFSKQFLLQWSLIGNDYYEEIEAVTGLDLKDVRYRINQMHHTENNPVALYSLRKISTDKILAVVGILLDIKEHYMVIYMPWNCMNNHDSPASLYMFVTDILYALDTIADVTINDYLLATDCEHVLDIFTKGRIPIKLGYSITCTNISEAKDSIYISRQSNSEKIKEAEQKGINNNG